MLSSGDKKTKQKIDDSGNAKGSMKVGETDNSGSSYDLRSLVVRVSLESFALGGRM